MSVQGMPTPDKIKQNNNATKQKRQEMFVLRAVVNERTGG